MKNLFVLLSALKKAHDEIKRDETQRALHLRNYYHLMKSMLGKNYMEKIIELTGKKE